MGQRGEEKGTNFRGILATWLIREPPRRARQGVRDRRRVKRNELDFTSFCGEGTTSDHREREKEEERVLLFKLFQSKRFPSTEGKE